MEFMSKNLPDAKCMESKAKQVWKKLNEDNIEIKITTSAMGLMLFAAGIGAAVCISKCISQMETKKALRKQKKALRKEAKITAESAE